MKLEKDYIYLLTGLRSHQCERFSLSRRPNAGGHGNIVHINIEYCYFVKLN